MANDITLYWAGPSDADANTDYRIESDKGTSGTFATVATVDATSPYASYTTTLDMADGLTATAVSLTVDDATNFADDDYVVIDRELILLGGKSSETFSTCTRNRGGTMPVAHADAATVANAHETYTDSAVNFGSRHCIRYRVIRVESSGESVAAEFLAVNPTLPPTNNLCRIWGVLDNMSAPVSGVTVSLAIADSDNYHTDTSEVIRKATQTATTDNDGYFELLIPRNISRAGGDNFTLTIDPGNSGEYARTITTVSDTDSVNFLLTT